MKQKPEWLDHTPAPCTGKPEPGPEYHRVTGNATGSASASLSLSLRAATPGSDSRLGVARALDPRGVTSIELLATGPGSGTLAVRSILS